MQEKDTEEYKNNTKGSFLLNRGSNLKYWSKAA